jgi:hypothetical protein
MKDLQDLKIEKLDSPKIKQRHEFTSYKKTYGMKLFDISNTFNIPISKIIRLHNTGELFIYIKDGNQPISPIAHGRSRTATADEGIGLGASPLDKLGSQPSYG